MNRLKPYGLVLTLAGVLVGASLAMRSVPTSGASAMPSFATSSLSQGSDELPLGVGLRSTVWLSEELSIVSSGERTWLLFYDVDVRSKDGRLLTELQGPVAVDGTGDATVTTEPFSVAVPIADGEQTLSLEVLFSPLPGQTWATTTGRNTIAQVVLADAK